MTIAADSRHVVSSFLAARNNATPAARDLMAPAFTFESPLLRYDDRDEYLASHRAFQQLVTGMTMISELYGSHEATLVYDLATNTPAGTQRTAEHFRLEGGKIASIMLVFDSAPWRRTFDAAWVDAGRPAATDR